MRRTAFAIGAVLALGLCAQAQAAPFGPEAEQALAYAPVYWDATPPQCPEGVTGQVLPLEQMVAADGDYVAGYAEPERCAITINELLSGSGLCAVVLHEYGHLLGYTHQDRLATDVSFRESPGCVALDDAFRRAGQWQLWRELRSWCRSTEGRQRRHCTQTVRRMRLRLSAVLSGT